MKKAIIYVACFFIVSAAAAAPGSKLIKLFNTTFPNAKDVQWKDDKAGFFVSFTQNGNYNKVFYNKENDFVYAIKYYSGDELPTNIIVAMNKAYGETKILGVTEVTTENSIIYNIKLTKKDKLYCLNVLPDGTVATEEKFTYENAGGQK